MIRKVIGGKQDQSGKTRYGAVAISSGKMIVVEFSDTEMVGLVKWMDYGDMDSNLLVSVRDWFRAPWTRNLQISKSLI